MSFTFLLVLFMVMVMVVGLDIVNNVLVVFHCFITEQTVQLNLLQISFFI